MKKQMLKTQRAKVIPISEAASAGSRAMDLLDRALETNNTAEARKLAREVIKLDPDCVDALILLAKCTRLSGDAYVEKLREAVQAGERSLGKEFLDKHRGHFWALMETRPYMRARFELAMALGGNGDIAGAITGFEEMLALNPNDNQGVREYLLAMYLALEDLRGAARLFDTYGLDSGAVFAWGAVFF